MNETTRKARPPLYEHRRQMLADAAYLVLASAAVNGFIINGCRGVFIPLTMMAGAAVLFALNLLALAAVIYAFCRSSMSDASRLTLRTLLVSSLTFASLCLSLPVTRVLIARDVHAAQARANAMLPALQAQLTTTGLYPTRLADVAGEQPLPRLLTISDAYRSTGTSFVMQIRIPGTAFQALVYHSGDREWQAVE